MILNNIKSRQKDSGFTIVELLVVIVVIGILAAITIVSYSNITSRAKSSQAQSNANSVVQVVNTYAADNNGGNGSFPANAAAITGYSGLSKIPAGLTITDATTSVGGYPASGDAQTKMYYLPKSTTGGCIGYWDTYGNGTPGPAYLLVGNAASATMTSGAATCS